MKIVLKPGDRLNIQIDGGDGNFEVLYDYQGDGKLRILADMPDSTERGGLPVPDIRRRNPKLPQYKPEIYCEDFSMSPLEDKKVAVEPDATKGRARAPIMPAYLLLKTLVEKLKNVDSLGLCDGVPEDMVKDRIAEVWESLPMDLQAEWCLTNEPPETDR